MRRGRLKSIVWGLLLIVSAVFIVLSVMGHIDNIGPVKTVFTILFAGIAITSLIDLNFFGVFFPMAFVGMIYDSQLGIEKLTPWPILGIALLLTIGFSLIFKKKDHCFHRDYSCGNEEYVVDMDIEDGEVIDCNAEFNGTVKYINSQNLKKINVKSAFGGVKLYLDGSEIPSKTAEINLNVSFGGVELYIPRNWDVKIQGTASFGSIEEKNKPLVNENSPVLYLTGSVKFSGVVITYV